MIKLVVSDMDGTLLNNKASISSENLNAIKKLENNKIEFAIASGRDFDGVHSIISHFGIQCEAILGNGAQYVDKSGNVLMSCYMNKSIIKDVLKIFEDVQMPYIIFTTNGFYTMYDPDYVKNMFIERCYQKFSTDKKEFEKGGFNENNPYCLIQKIEDIDTFLKCDNEIIKIEAFSLDESIVPARKELLKNVPHISFLSSFNDNVEVTDENAQKGYILEKVVQLKGINKDEVMVLGDGMNDISLFQCFKYSFATGNAEEKIKELAYKVVADCEDNGFKEAIDYMIK